MTDSRWFSRTGRVLVLILAPIQPLAAVDYHVAPGGNDAWSGLTATPNAAGDDGPLATLTAARDAVRRYRAAHPDPEPVRVLVAGGSYALTEPFQLGPEDGGTAAAPVVYAAAPGARPVFSGGRPIGGWRVGPGGSGRPRWPGWPKANGISNNCGSTAAAPSAPARQTRAGIPSGR